MGYTAMDKIVSLIHEWCEENKLLETSRILKEEYQSKYGKGIKDPVHSSLKQIIQTHQRLKLLIAPFINNGKESKTGTHCGKKSDSRKRKKDPRMPHDTLPTGEWVCPEVESILYSVNDRQQLDLSIPSTDDTTNKSPNQNIKEEEHISTMNESAVEVIQVNKFDSHISQDQLKIKVESAIHSIISDTSIGKSNKVPVCEDENKDDIVTNLNSIQSKKIGSTKIGGSSAVENLKKKRSKLNVDENSFSDHHIDSRVPRENDNEEHPIKWGVLNGNENERRQDDEWRAPVMNYQKGVECIKQEPVEVEQNRVEDSKMLSDLGDMLKKKKCKSDVHKVHMVRTFSCSVCNNYFASKSEKKQHKKCHSNPLKCGLCGRLFSQRCDLKSHEKIHIGKPHECTKCGKCFASEFAKRDHERSHS